MFDEHLLACPIIVYLTWRPHTMHSLRFAIFNLVSIYLVPGRAGTWVTFLVSSWLLSFFGARGPSVFATSSIVYFFALPVLVKYYAADNEFGTRTVLDTFLCKLVPSMLLSTAYSWNGIYRFLPRWCLIWMWEKMPRKSPHPDLLQLCMGSPT